MQQAMEMFGPGGAFGNAGLGAAPQPAAPADTRPPEEVSLLFIISPFTINSGRGKVPEVKPIVTFLDTSPGPVFWVSHTARNTKILPTKRLTPDLLTDLPFFHFILPLIYNTNTPSRDTPMSYGN